MSRLRLLSQISFFLLFIVLFLKTSYSGEMHISKAVRFFLEADPFLALTIILEAKGFPAGLARLFLLSGLVIGLTLLLGRFFCGWVCPLGSLLHLASYSKKLSKKKIANGIYSVRQKIKYGVLVVLLVLALFSVNCAGLVDPISLLVRSMTMAVFPAFHFATGSISTTMYHLDWPLLTPASEFIYSSLRDNIFPLEFHYFKQNLFIAALFILILLLNRIRPRFWCRYVCPLGALLAVSSTTSRVQRNVSTACNECNICHATCQGAPARSGAKDWNPQECFLCFNCRRVCPEKAVTFSFKRAHNPSIRNLLPSRRAFLQATGASIVSVPLLLTAPHLKTLDPRLVRPPGALLEADFLNRCVRCGECMKVCPTNGLHPTLFEAGLEGIWSPVFNMKLGYCEYNCTLCGQVCPSGAIRELTEQEKHQTRIGLAFIDVSRCLPFAFGIDCIVCEEHCPTPEKAIYFEEKEIMDRTGERRVLKFPKVDPLLCIGCGICENKCPVVDRRAIYVTAVNESRNEDNQLILDV